MTTEQLHDILDDANRKLTIDELKQIIYELKLDTSGEYNKEFDAAQEALTLYLTHKHEKLMHFYSGETNAFQICLDLLEHLKGAEK